MKRIIAALLAGLCLFALVGCSAGSKADSAAPKDYSQILHDARTDEENEYDMIFTKGEDGKFTAIDGYSAEYEAGQLDDEVRSILLPLKAIAAAQRCAVLLVMHSNKKQGVSDRKRLADSSDIWDMARSVLMMGRSNSDGKIYLSHEKSSYSRPQQTVLLHIEDVELDGVRTAQAVFDGYTDKKDADFIKEPRVRQAQTRRTRGTPSSTCWPRAGWAAWQAVSCAPPS